MTGWVRITNSDLEILLHEETSHNDDNITHNRATPPNDTTAPLDVNETPSTRALRITRTEAVKGRVDNATENLTGQRCVVHNTEHIYAVEYAHVLPRASKYSVITNLEVSWNMTNNTLNVDSRFNIFHLSADMHRMFDRGRWLLIPEQRVVDIFKEKLTKPIQEYVTEPTYRYRLIASKEMIHFPIFRLNDLVPADPPDVGS
ncbi:hypothetical protein E4T56_gene2927 [Termitomyces sp. T112]|nr:hypothetical protein E4T56_gene2927 [Termitomyces sp. T112]